MKNYVLLIALFLAVLSAGLVHSCRSAGYGDSYTMIKEGQTLIKEGDLVVRLNRDPSSQFIKNFNRHDKSYSHAGLVICESGHPYVFHILNGRENPSGKLRKDLLAQFSDPTKNFAYGIFRYDLSPNEIKKLKDIIQRWYRKGVRFDYTFDFRSDDRMYCSEMIGRALEQATGKRISIEATTLTCTEARFFSIYTHRSFGYTSGLKIIPIDALYTTPFCHLIKKYDYRQRVQPFKGGTKRSDSYAFGEWPLGLLQSWPKTVYKSINKKEVQMKISFTIYSFTLKCCRFLSVGLLFCLKSFITAKQGRLL